MISHIQAGTAELRAEWLDAIQAEDAKRIGFFTMRLIQAAIEPAAVTFVDAKIAGDSFTTQEVADALPTTVQPGTF